MKQKQDYTHWYNRIKISIKNIDKPLESWIGTQKSDQ